MNAAQHNTHVAVKRPLAEKTQSIINQYLKWFPLKNKIDQMIPLQWSNDSLLNYHFCSVCKGCWHRVDSNPQPVVFEASILPLSYGGFEWLPLINKWMFHLKMEMWLKAMENISINKYELYRIKEYRILILW